MLFNHRGFFVRLLSKSRLLQYLNYNMGIKEHFVRRFNCLLSIEGCGKRKPVDRHFPLKVADAAAEAFTAELARRVQEHGAKPIVVLNRFRRDESAPEVTERRQHWADVTSGWVESSGDRDREPALTTRPENYKYRSATFDQRLAQSLTSSGRPTPASVSSGKNSRKLTPCHGISLSNNALARPMAMVFIR